MASRLIRKPHRPPSGHTPDVGRGQRIHEARQRLLHPPKPAESAVAEIVPVPAPLDPALFRMGTDLSTGRELLVRPELLDRHPHLLFVGAPGTGKTTKMLAMINSLLSLPEASIFIGNPKGRFGQQVIDLVLARGQAHRLDVLDPGDERYVATYNPVHVNSLSWAIHAKQLREGIRQSANLTSFDIAAQMGRCLFMFLAMTRLFDLTLADTVQLVRPKSVLRRQLIPKVPDPDLRFALEYFDSLPERRQDELGSSSMAKLESFAFDPILRRITSRKGHSLDICEMIANHKMFVADLREDDPLRVDDARLLGIFLVNDIVAHVFGRKDPVTPCYLVLDEAYAHMTDDLARALSRGREPGLHVWLACQYVDQFILEDGNTRIRDTVMKCIENRIVFRTPDVDDAKQLATQLFFAHTYNPWAEKYARQSIEAEPVESTRIVEGTTHSVSTGEAVAYPRSRSVGTNQSDTVGSSESASVGTNETWNTADTRGTSVTDAEAHARMVAETQAHTTMDGLATSKMAGRSEMAGRGQMQGATQAHADMSVNTTTAGLTRPYESLGAVLPSEWIYSDSRQSGAHASDTSAKSEGASEFSGRGSMTVEGETAQHADADTTARTVANTLSRSQALSASESHTDGHSLGTSVVHTTESSKSHTVGTNETRSEGVTPSFSREEGHGQSRSVVPFISFLKREVTLDKQFLSEDEQIALHAIAILRVPDQHYFLQLATLPTRAMREPDSTPLMLSDEARAAELLAIHTRPMYTLLTQIEAEEQEGNTRTAKGKKTSGLQKAITSATTEQASSADPSPAESAAKTEPLSFWQ